MSITQVTPAGGNIFVDLSVPDAENEKLRLSLIAEIREWVSNSGLTQAEAAVAKRIYAAPELMFPENMKPKVQLSCGTYAGIDYASLCTVLQFWQQASRIMRLYDV